MYKRYNDTKIQNDEDGKRFLDQVIYPEIITTEEDLYIISTRGDRLDIFAHQYLGDATLWYVIAQANHLGKGTLAIPPGLQIRIPTKTSIQQITQDFKNINNS
ncbi:hypothetical protein M0P65_06105 [Candidatus Gracilibacteria bacterium]|jgi:nucleoid-associated protein YgaU|nr:hypothetical protein [Candidatus Gracilibacteria bacterium]